METIGPLRYSHISALLQCPRKFELTYVLKREVLSKPSLFLGGAVHKALAEGYRRKIDGQVLTVDEMLAVYDGVWEKSNSLEDEDNPREVDWRGDDKGQHKDTGIELLKKYWATVQPRVVPLEVEYTLRREIDGVLMSGTVDLLSGDGLVDYKTAARAFSQAEVANALQPTIYALLLGGPTKGAFHLLVKTKVPQALVMPFERTEADLSWVRRWLLPRVVAQIRAGIFPPNISSFLCHSSSCEVWHLCRGG